ncbi:MAG: hypothetical protein GWM87_11860 [Xanthomonadales bacterium]|nr:hypothetical protein [Xanthomonadales bacterium]NIX13549.1 hypothetical protein [Xanthomonadales bacterium]
MRIQTYGMTGTLRMAAWLAICLAGAFPVGLAAADTGKCDSLEPLEWLVGEWQTSAGPVIAVESWTRVAPGTFEGYGEARSAETGKVTNRETLRLVEMSGEVFYIAMVAHNDFPVPFRLTACSGGTFEFENPGHDFPTRIAYRRTPPDRFVVMVSNADGGGFSLDFGRPPVTAPNTALPADATNELADR